MSEKIDPITQMVLDAVSGGYAISSESIRQLRAKSEKEITTLKTVFWIAIGMLNIMIWNPFSVSIPESLRWSVALGSLLIATVFPIIGIRRHRRILYRLEDSDRGPKRRKADDAGRRYIDLVKKQARVFIRAEYDVLDGDQAPE